MPTELKIGSTGADVTKMQTLLRTYAQRINAPAIDPRSIDGVFGETTRLAVLAFQKQVFVPQTGVVAELTWEALFKQAPVRMQEVKFGEKSEFVRLLEERLIALGFLRGTADQFYEQRTLDAVSAFQRSANLPQKSTVNEKMWFELSKRAVV